MPLTSKSGCHSFSCNSGYHRAEQRETPRLGMALNCRYGMQTEHRSRGRVSVLLREECGHRQQREPGTFRGSKSVGRQSGARPAAFLRFLLPGTAGPSAAAPASASASAAAAPEGSATTEVAADPLAARPASLPRRRRLLGGGCASALGAAPAATASPRARVALLDVSAACCGASLMAPPCADTKSVAGAAAAAALAWSCAACSRSRWAACSRFTLRTCRMHQRTSADGQPSRCRPERSSGACISLTHGSGANAWAC
jgi:hypothetical protein